MIYLSIDIETTGLNPETCQILEIGAIYENSKIAHPFDTIPTFRAILAHNFIQGEPNGLKMNNSLIESIIDYSTGDRSNNLPFFNPETVLDRLFEWYRHIYIQREHMEPQHLINVAGKNFGSFDYQFLKKLPNNTPYNFNHKVLDPGSLYFNNELDWTLPGLDKCKERAGISGKVSHTALGDAWDVIQVLRYVL